MQDVGFRILGLECVEDVGRRMWGVGCGVQDVGCRMWGVGCGV